MKNNIENAFDFRQSPFWGKYMHSIGWHVETIGGMQIYIRHLPFLHISFIKIQHPLPPYSFAKIDTIAKKYNAIWTVIEPHLYRYTENQFKNSGYIPTRMHHAPTATTKIPIDAPMQKIIASFSENAKRNLKKAQKNNLKIKVVFPKNDKDNAYFETFYQLQKNLTDIKKFYAPGYAESKKKNEALKNGSFFVFAYQEDRENPIAAVWYGFHKGVVTYLQTGITQKGYDLLANYLLVLEGIKVGKKLGCTVFDFESIYDTRYPKEAKRWIGYSEFKSRFHGKEIYYPPSWIKIYNPLLSFFYKRASSFSTAQTTYPSPIHTMITVGKSYGNKTIFVKGIPQSGGELVQMWQKIFGQLKKKKQIVQTCLVLGVGGGDVIRLLAENYSGCKITAVEIDEIMVTIAKKQFSLNEKNTTIVIADAVMWLQKLERDKKFDLIIVDLFLGPHNPHSARKTSFLRLVKQHREKNGIVLYNSHYQKGRLEEYEDFRKTANTIFPNVEEVFSYPRNRVLLLS